MTIPEVPFAHLLAMTDTVGLLEHANGAVPAYEHGYCVDDVARGLVVVCREPSPSPELITVAQRYLGFLAESQSPDGQIRNRLSYDRRWRGEPGVEDCWGRALWGFGTAAARGPTAALREEALDRFCRSARMRSTFPHAMAFAALGAAEVAGAPGAPGAAEARPGHEAALSLLADAVTVIGAPGTDPAWLWPAPRLTYANGAIAEAVIAAGTLLRDDETLRRGLLMLDWLMTVESRDGHLSVTPAGGWGPGESRPGFDQQPIEVAALADACQRAAAVTGNPRWLAGVRMSVAWYLGDNDAGISMLDEQSGGGCDGLRPTSRNGNQGAESTLAMMSVLQHGRRLTTPPG